MYIRRSRSVLLSYPAIGYPDVKCRRTERPHFPSGCEISGCKMSVHEIREYHTRMIAYPIRICCPDGKHYSSEQALQLHSESLSHPTFRHYPMVCPDIFAMDSKEFSLISDCFGDQKVIKTPKLNTI